VRRGTLLPDCAAGRAHQGTVRQLSWLCVITWVAAASGARGVTRRGASVRLGAFAATVRLHDRSASRPQFCNKTGNFLGVDAGAARGRCRVRQRYWPCRCWRSGRSRTRPAALVVHCYEQLLVSTASAGLVLLLWNAGSSRWARFFAIWPQPVPWEDSATALYLFHLPAWCWASAWFSFMPHGLAVPAFGSRCCSRRFLWWLFEGPINNLKQYFPLSEPAARGDSRAGRFDHLVASRLAIWPKISSSSSTRTGPTRAAL
jgi:hypothetical protein